MTGSFLIRAGLIAAFVVSGSALAQSTAAGLNDYPTEARADYVFGCMAANGQSREMLQKCSCSIDRIASILTYDDYVEAETVLSLQQAGGERMSVFKSAQFARDYVANLRRAQAEAEILCF
jgi:lysyl-tRNA synthetase class II